VGIGAGQLQPRAFCGEHPLDACTTLVALLFPRLDFTDEAFTLADLAVQALAPQHANFEFHHIQPARMLRGIMEFQALENPVRLLSREGFVERARSMRRQIIQHYADKIGFCIMNIHQIAHAVRKVRRRAMIGDLDVTPGLVRVQKNKQIRGAIAPVLAIVSGSGAKIPCYGTL
jgi:hypothetical protein